MPENNEPYITRQPGDQINAEDWNQMQVDIKNDIGSQVKAAKDEIVAGKVKEAENAERFASSGEKEWLEKLDQRYAANQHNHEGQSVYQRYIKRFVYGTEEVLLEHKLGRFPLVDVYELFPVTVVGPASADETDLRKAKLLVYYGHADADKYKLFVKVFRDRIPLGYPLEQLLTELGVEYEDDDNLQDVINDMWTAFMKDPNDEIDHNVTPWITDCWNKKRTVADLKKTDQWPDLHVAIKPQKWVYKGPGGKLVTVGQIDYGNLHIKVDGLSAADTLDLMFLLRI